jgi:hypothetical protein
MVSLASNMFKSAKHDTTALGLDEHVAVDVFDPSKL